MTRNNRDDNTLSKRRPDLALEWHPTKNGTLSPNEVTVGSHKKVWWMGRCGHEWEAAISNRVSRGSGCPLCGRKARTESLSKTLLKKSGSLLETNPNLVKEWHPTKNGSLLPEDISAGVKTKVWWIGKCGHEWQTSVYVRAKLGRGCPICGRKKQVDSRHKNLLKRKGSLLEINPELAKEWHPTKNGELTANDVSVGSNKKVWWIGKCGHEWQASIVARYSGTGCPLCGRKARTESLSKTLLKKSGSLLETNPELVKEWNPIKNGELTANDVSAGSNRKVWWICELGHEWEASVYHRAKRGECCPICSKNKRIDTYKETMLMKSGSLKDTNPVLAQEWHPTKNGELTPEMVTPNNNDIKVWWLGKCGHEWEARIASRSAGSGCPICGGKTILTGFNDLATKYPYLVKEWHPTRNGAVRPTNVAPKSMKKVWWQCPKGHEWRASIASRTQNGNGCIYCAMERQTSFPEQALFFYFSHITSAINRYTDNNNEIDVYLPEMRIGIEYDGMRYHNSERSKKKEIAKDAFFKELGIRVIHIKESNENRIDSNIIYYKYTPSYVNLPWAITELLSLIGIQDQTIHIDLDRDRGDIYDLYIQREKENSLASKYPELIDEWNTKKNKISPLLMPAASNKKVWWICAKGHEWCAQVNSRIRGSGCPICSGKKVLIGFNDLKTVNPELAKEWHPTKNLGLLPTDVTLNSGKKIWWICSCGCEWQTSPAQRSRGSGCPVCGRKKAIDSRIKTEISQKGSLLDNNPIVAKEWHPTKNGQLTAKDVTAGSNKKVWWKGKCGHEWISSPHNRINGSGCPICKGKALSVQYNDLQTVNPRLATEWHPTKKR